MDNLQKTSVGIAALCAVSGAVLMAVFGFRDDPGGHLLVLAGGVAAVAAVSVLFGVLALARQRCRGAALSGASANCCQGGCFKARREVLDVRLHIDEPRLCSHHKVSCTCWSLCGTASVSDQPAKVIQIHRSKPEGSLPVIQRKPIDDCPFRYASPAG